jgi:hypothetical protein
VVQLLVEEVVELVLSEFLVTVVVQVAMESKIALMEPHFTMLEAVVVAALITAL